nr:ribonuclease H-like domain-containing protein [Anaerolineae bacterium]
MTDREDLRKRLIRLGLTRAKDIQPRPKTPKNSPGIEALFPDGETVSTEAGSCYRITETFSPDFVHGTQQLGAWLHLKPETLALIGDSNYLAVVAPENYLFLDTETTGLGGGSFAFLIGCGFFTADLQFVVQQYFLRGPSEEETALRLVDSLLGPEKALVTFNGQTFDIPLLASRCVMNRCSPRISSIPNLDLLHPARRLWRRRLSSCSLGSLESHILQLARTQKDVPGSLIPYLYRQYLQTGNARDMARVVYHNTTDLLSMVSLGIIIAYTFSSPDAPSLPVDDQLSLARWYESRQLLDEAEKAYRQAADRAPDAITRYNALVGIAYLLKRAGRRSEAIPFWEYLADLKHDVVGHTELAKHYEWHEMDIERAAEWTGTAIRLAESWRPGWRRSQTLKDLNHRQARLKRKLAGRPNAVDEIES